MKWDACARPGSGADGDASDDVESRGGGPVVSDFRSNISGSGDPESVVAMAVKILGLEMLWQSSEGLMWLFKDSR